MLTLSKNWISSLCRENMRTKITYKEKFLDMANNAHGDFYCYDQIPDNFKRSDKIKIICPTHGEFFQIVGNHLLGKGCKKCSNNRFSSLRFGMGDYNKFIENAIIKHGNLYDYSSVDYVNSKTKVKIICKIHGSFLQRPDSHLSGSGCKKCMAEKLSASNKSNTEDFVKKSIEIHNQKYSYELSEYCGALQDIEITCDIHGSFFQKPQNHLRGKGCRKCANMSSSLEEFIESFLTDNNINFVKNDRSIISPKELDFIIPDKKIAIECHGLYWHSFEKNQDKNRHLNKLNLSLDNGYKLIQIFEDEIIFKPKIVESRLKSIFGIIENKIYARKCVVKKINHKECNEFLSQNHIQGSDKSSERLGLFYNDKLVSVMTFSKVRRSLGNKHSTDWELVRFCNISNFSIIGAASKLFAFFRETSLTRGDTVVSYADRRWSDGNLYYKLGFQLSHFSKPNYWYFKCNELIRYHRFSFRKDRISKFSNSDSQTEFQIMKDLKYNRIYDCGNICFKFTKQ